MAYNIKGDVSVGRNVTSETISLNYDGSLSEPSISFTTGDRLGLMIDVSGNVNFIKGGLVEGVIEPQGVSVNYDRTLMTREKGDARYARQDVANLFTANQTIKSLDDNWVGLTLATSAGPVDKKTWQIYNRPDTGDFGIRQVTDDLLSTNALYRFTDDATLTSDNDVVTRTKGDARYARLSADNTFQTHITTNGSILINAEQPVIRWTETDQLDSLVGKRSDLYSLNGNMYFKRWNGDYSVGRDVAVITDSGTSAPSLMTVMTREKSDARYLRADTTTRVNFWLELESASPLIRMTDTDQPANYRTTDIARSDKLYFYDRNDDGSVREIIAVFDSNGSTMSSPVSVITREKGDARYAQLSANNYLTGKIGIQTEPITESTADLFLDSDLIFANDNKAIMFNAYWDSNWKACTSGYSSFIKQREDQSEIVIGIVSARHNLGKGEDIADLLQEAATIVPRGSAAPTWSTVITREKGDARYAQLGDNNTYTGAAQTIYKTGAGWPEWRLHTENPSVDNRAARFRISASTGEIAIDALNDAGSNQQTYAFDRSSTLPSVNSVVRRSTGDARYAQLGVSNVFTGVGAQAAPTLAFDNKTGGGMGFYSVPGNVGANDILRASVNGLAAFDIYPAGTAAPTERTAMSREKGDARYVQIANLNNLSDDIYIKNASPQLRLYETDSGLTGSFWYNVLANNGINEYFYANGTSNRIRYAPLNGDGATLIAFYVAGVEAARIVTNDEYTVGSSTIMTRLKGDTRYTLASSGLKYKSNVQAIDTDLSGLTTKQFVWGGELTEDDPRRGKTGVGLVAEEVEAILPEAVIYDKTGRPEGLDALTLIGALVNEVNKLRKRLDDAGL